MKKLVLLLCLLASPAFAQPAPVPALPDTERRTSYAISASTCACSVGFALYGDSTDVDHWIEVWIDGVRYLSTDVSHGWALTSASGPLATIARPITNAVLTFTAAQTGTVQIVGARRPRRLSQFSENRGVAARDLNQALTDIIAQNRETWDKTNDVTGRSLLGLPGETITQLPSAALRAGGLLAFDGSGNPTITSGGLGSGNVIGPNGGAIDGGPSCFNGTTGIIIKNCSPQWYNAANYGWLCDSTDRSTQAQALLNLVGNSGGGTIFFPACDGTNTYRADSKLTFVQLNTNPGSTTSQANLRFTGPGGGLNINNRKQGWATNSNAAVLDLRYQGQVASAITEVAAVGAGGSDGTRTITLVGGTFTTAATYSAVVAGGVITGIPTLIDGGAYTAVPANPVAVTGGGLVGATLTAFWTGGKIQSLGAGTLQIDHLGFIDGGSSNSTPFLYSTNTIMLVNNNTFIGTGNSQQDAIVLGGMKASGFINPPNQNADSPFLGYGTWIDSNNFEGLNRAVYVRTFGNEVKITNNIAGVCAGERFIEWHGKVAIESSGGIVTGNYTEACASLRYGYVLSNSVTNTVFSGNAVWDVDANPNFVSDYYLVTSNAAGNTFILGHHDGTKAIFSGSTDAINSSIIIGALTNFYQPASGNSSFSAQFQGLLVGGYYGATNNPHGQLAIVSSLDAGAGSLQLAVDPTTGFNYLDSVNLAGSGAGQPLKINSHGAATQFGGFVQMLGATASFPGFKRSATAVSFRLADDSADAPITASDVTGSGTIRANTAFNANGTAGASATVSVRKGDDSGACNLVFSLGLYVSTTC